MYVISVNQQLRKVHFYDGESDIAVVGRIRNAFAGGKRKLPFAFGRRGTCFLMSKSVLGWIDLMEVSWLNNNSTSV